MKVRCVFVPLVFNERNMIFKPLEKYENWDIVTHFRLDFFSLKQEIQNDHDFITLEWVERELIKSSVPYVYEKEKSNKQVFFHFNDYTWIYDYNTQNIYMINSDIDI